MGDAAHASTPWQGSGAGQAIEDAMVLGAVLGNIKSAHQLNAAFRAYDSVRRPRAGRIVASSQETGQIMCGKGPDIGLDVEKIRAALGSKWDFIHNQSQKAQIAMALAALL
jgi:salicylate hydroxylase